MYLYVSVCSVYLSSTSEKEKGTCPTFLLCLLQKKKKRVKFGGVPRNDHFPSPKEWAFLEWCNQYDWEMITFGWGWGMWIIVSQAIPMCTPCVNLNCA